MKIFTLILISILTTLISCQKKETNISLKTKNDVSFANGLEIHRYKNFTIMKVTKPWPNATKVFTYICANNKNNIPDSLKSYTFIKTPITHIVTTSTTHVSSLAIFDKTNVIKGFPHLEYISNENARKQISQGLITELSDNESLNFEKTIDLKPELIVGLSIDNETAKFNQFEKAGIPVIYNADWVETSPLGKAEWIKFFGVLLDMQDEANNQFNFIVTNYNNAKNLVKNIDKLPTVLSGALYQDIWYAPQGESWMAAFIADAKGNYLWKNETGTGSLSLSLESVLEKGTIADFWIGPGQFVSYEEMETSNKHYSQFKSFKNKKVFSYSMKKGITGGTIFYEDAANRPDIVLKDLIYILHPNTIKNYTPTFIEALK